MFATKLICMQLALHTLACRPSLEAWCECISMARHHMHPSATLQVVGHAS